MIPQIQPWIDELEQHEVMRVMQSTYLTENRATKEFEIGLETLTGIKHAIAVCNGTAALYCILRALDIGPGDEVLVPDMTFIASSNAVVMAGAKPVFSPVKTQTLDFDMGVLPSLITTRTKAIMAVHLYGQSSDMDAIGHIASQYGLKVIEDAAQAIGVKFKEQHVGCYGEAGAISFYGNKTITCGEGGVILTNNDQLADVCRQLKNHGRSHRGTFIHEHIGFNFSWTEMQAAVGIAQLRKLPAIIQRKQEIYNTYTDAFSNIPQLKTLAIDPRCQPVHWFTSFYAERRAELGDYLTSHGIQTRLFFCPLHLQPCYEGWSDEKVDYSASQEAYAKGISLPSSFILTDEELNFIIGKVRDFYLTAEASDCA
jgi:perosamine synthetase